MRVLRSQSTHDSKRAQSRDINSEVQYGMAHTVWYGTYHMIRHILYGMASTVWYGKYCMVWHVLYGTARIVWYRTALIGGNVDHSGSGYSRSQCLIKKGDPRVLIVQSVHIYTPGRTLHSQTITNALEHAKCAKIWPLDFTVPQLSGLLHTTTSSPPKAALKTWLVHWSRKVELYSLIYITILSPCCESTK